MATYQDTYSDTFARGYPGQIANGETSNRISRTVEDAAGIGFGKAAFRGTGDRGCTGTPNAATFLGFVIADHGEPMLVSGGEDKVAQYGSAALLNDGVILVSCSTSCADGDPVYVTSGGVITNVSTSNVLLPADFDETLAAAGVVAVRVRRQAT